MDGLKPQAFKHIRQRMIGCILATDMAKHASDLASLKQLIDSKGISQGENAHLVLNREND